jgi:predicted secreted protein
MGQSLATKLCVTNKNAQSCLSWQSSHSVKFMTTQAHEMTPKYNDVHMTLPLSCVVCLEEDGRTHHENSGVATTIAVAPRYFMPCRCRVMVCDACIGRITSCLYHRTSTSTEQDAAGIRTTVGLQRQFTFTFHRMAELSEHVRLLTQALGESQAVIVQHRQTRASLRTTVLLSSLYWVIVFMLKDVVYILLRPPLFAHFLSFVAVSCHVVFLVNHRLLSVFTIRLVVWWASLFAVIVMSLFGAHAQQ